jgi:predicted ATPase
MTSDEIRQVIEKVFRIGKIPDFEYAVVRNRFFLFARTKEGVQSTLMEWIGPIVEGLIHVPGLRGNRERTYPVAALGPDFPSTFEYYVASVIEDWQSKGNPLSAALNNDLKHLNLAESVVARRLTEVEIDLQVSRLRGRKNDMVSIADVGLGVVHTLPVLVALRVADVGRLVYIEQPEIHLHPRAQVKLADILADAAKHGVRVVAETHSTLLLTAIQTLVAKGELRPELVKLHWFQRDPKTGVTEVSSTDLDENGAFAQSDWPEDFDDVILKADGAYLDAVEGRQVR